ncbi:hypothetical protein A7P64_23600 [Salmonella enterica subsp. enterica serovar Typhi]|nr:hypothetical protein A7P64_23600 [Salmonella enterica subsp. enterica serovar Typhi]
MLDAPGLFISSLSNGGAVGWNIGGKMSPASRWAQGKGGKRMFVPLQAIRKGGVNPRCFQVSLFK